jgi:hypothetical protein
VVVHRFAVMHEYMHRLLCMHACADAAHAYHQQRSIMWEG